MEYELGVMSNNCMIV